MTKIFLVSISQCDRDKPNCHRCQKAGLRCAGYTADTFVLVVPTETPGEKSNKVKLRRARNIHKESSNSIEGKEKRSGKIIHTDQDDGDMVLQLSPRACIDVAPENRMQILSYFLEKYLSASVTGQRKILTPSSWILSLPSLLGRWEVLDTSLSAVCLAYIGDIHKDPVHLQESQRFYNVVLRKLRSLRLDSPESANEGVLTTTMTMAMYEV